MASFDREDEEFWENEMDVANDGARPFASTEAASGSTCGGSAVQCSITQFFGDGSVTPPRSCSNVPRPKSTAPSSTPRRGPAGRSSRAVTVASRSCASPDAVVPTNSDSDSADISLTHEEKDRVHSSTSLVWKYFKKISKDSAKCNLCGAEPKTPTGSTTLLTRHLAKSHVSQHSEYCRLQNIKQKLARGRAIQKKKNVPVKRLVAFPLDSKGQRAKEITKAVAVFIAKGLKPYSVVQEPGFIGLVNLLEPRYIVPSRSQFSRNIIPSMYQDGKKKLQTRLQELSDNESLESISLTIDAWTSRKLDSFLAFTLQFTRVEGSVVCSTSVHNCFFASPTSD